MDILTFVLAVLAVCQVGVAFQARRLGNDQRDVALLGLVSGLWGAGATASALLSV